MRPKLSRGTPSIRICDGRGGEVVTRISPVPGPAAVTTTAADAAAHGVRGVEELLTSPLYCDVQRHVPGVLATKPADW